jgi:AraC-like DNA-binding protein
LEKAKEILDDSGFEGCIEDVAIRSGFNSVSTFRRSFQKKYGCTPSQYRKNALGHR